MRRFSLVIIGAILLVAGALNAAEDHQHGKDTAPAKKAVLHGRMTSFSSPSGEASGYLSLPAGKGKHGAIVVIHEWWGLNGWVKEQADRFAKEGYVALAPDLYHGKVAEDPNLAHELMRGLPEDRAGNDLQGAFDYLHSRSDVDPNRIGVIGWCMGGGYSLGLAIREPRVAACVINYGRLVTDPKTIAGIKPSILGNFGAEDRGIPPKDVEAFEQALKKDHKSADIKVYKGAGHAFMNPDNKDGYVAEAASDAWKRIDSFLAVHLRR